MDRRHVRFHVSSTQSGTMRVEAEPLYPQPAYQLYLRDCTTGEARLVATEQHWVGDSGVEYLWTEGNYACDCNRMQYFRHARGEYAEPIACGAGRFSLRVLDPRGGVVYDEDAPEGAG